MPGAIHDLLATDHARLDGLLARGDADPARIDLDAYEELRAGLLRHIAMEEKVLLPHARRLRGGEPLAIAKQLKLDHAALASLLIPSPTHALIVAVREVLAEHNPLEEGPHGMYAACEALLGSDAERIIDELGALPPIRVSAHLDEPRVHEHIARALAARRPRVG